MKLGRRLLVIALIAAALMVPLLMIYALTWERGETAAKVETDITRGWAGDQVVRGPYLVVPYTEYSEQTVLENGATRTVRTPRRDAVVVAADRLQVAARLDPTTRRRSLYEVVVYDSRLDIDASFSAATVAGAGIDPALLDWRNAYVVASLSDPRGYGGTLPRWTIGGRTVEPQPGARGVSLIGAALTAPAGLTAALSQPLRFKTSLALKGTKSFQVASSARRIDVAVTSAWPHPSFVGAMLPDSRRIAKDGFSAIWSTSYLALNRPMTEKASAPAGLQNGGAVAGVALIEPVDLYAQVGRAVKYGALFIALTFLTYFVFDLTGRRRVPTHAYALVGLGLVLFFLLLLALAEYLSLVPAYLIAAGAQIALIAAYSRSVLQSDRRAGIIAVVLAILYAGLFVLLRMEDYALLVGSLTLFAALATLMYVTRNIGDERVA